MWLLGSDADPQIGASSIEKVSQLVKDGGGSVVSGRLWGRRTLSYPIDKNNEAYYFLLYFTLDAQEVPAFERALDADQLILRYLLTLHPWPVEDGSQVNQADDQARRSRRRVPS